jgi:hypothetical protein
MVPRHPRAIQDEIELAADGKSIQVISAELRVRDRSNLRKIAGVYR